jgi:hypothetical protein
LIGQHRAGVNVDANKIAIASRRQSQRGMSIVAQDIETDRQLDGIANRASGHRHARNRFRSNGRFCERHIAEIFDDDRVRAAFFIGMRVGDRFANDLRQFFVISWRTGQRREMDDSNERFAFKRKEIHAGMLIGRINFASLSFILGLLRLRKLLRESVQARPFPELPWREGT